MVIASSILAFCVQGYFSWKRLKEAAKEGFTPHPIFFAFCGVVVVAGCFLIMVTYYFRGYF